MINPCAKCGKTPDYPVKLPETPLVWTIQCCDNLVEHEHFMQTITDWDAKNFPGKGGKP